MAEEADLNRAVIKGALEEVSTVDTPSPHFRSSEGAMDGPGLWAGKWPRVSNDP